MTFANFDLYFHMVNHYKKIKNAKAVVDCKSPKGYNKRHCQCKPVKYPPCVASRPACQSRNVRSCSPECHIARPNCPHAMGYQRCSVSAPPCRPEWRERDICLQRAREVQLQSIIAVQTRLEDREAAINSTKARKGHKKRRSTDKAQRREPNSMSTPSREESCFPCWPGGSPEEPSGEIEVEKPPDQPAKDSTARTDNPFKDLIEEKTERKTNEVLEHEYVHFLLKITEDILRNNIYGDIELENLFKSHIEANKGRLDEKRMVAQIDTLRKELNLPFTNKPRDCSLSRDDCKCCPQRPLRPDDTEACTCKNMNCPKRDWAKECECPEVISKTEDEPIVAEGEPIVAEDEPIVAEDEPAVRDWAKECECPEVFSETEDEPVVAKQDQEQADVEQTNISQPVSKTETLERIKEEDEDEYGRKDKKTKEEAKKEAEQEPVSYETEQCSPDLCEERYGFDAREYDLEERILKPESKPKHDSKTELKFDAKNHLLYADKCLSAHENKPSKTKSNSSRCSGSPLSQSMHSMVKIISKGDTGSESQLILYIPPDEKDEHCFCTIALQKTALKIQVEDANEEYVLVDVPVCMPRTMLERRTISVLVQNVSSMVLESRVRDRSEEPSISKLNLFVPRSHEDLTPDYRNADSVSALIRNVRDSPEHEITQERAPKVEGAINSSGTTGSILRKNGKSKDHEHKTEAAHSGSVSANVKISESPDALTPCGIATCKSQQDRQKQARELFEHDENCKAPDCPKKLARKMYDQKMRDLGKPSSSGSIKYKSSGGSVSSQKAHGEIPLMEIDFTPSGSRKYHFLLQDATTSTSLLTVHTGRRVSSTIKYSERQIESVKHPVEPDLRETEHPAKTPPDEYLLLDEQYQLKQFQEEEQPPKILPPGTTSEGVIKILSAIETPPERSDPSVPAAHKKPHFQSTIKKNEMPTSSETTVPAEAELPASSSSEQQIASELPPTKESEMSNLPPPDEFPVADASEAPPKVPTTSSERLMQILKSESATAPPLEEPEETSEPSPEISPPQTTSEGVIKIISSIEPKPEESESSISSLSEKSEEKAESPLEISPPQTTSEGVIKILSAIEPKMETSESFSSAISKDSKSQLKTKTSKKTFEDVIKDISLMRSKSEKSQSTIPEKISPPQTASEGMIQIISSVEPEPGRSESPQKKTSEETIETIPTTEPNKESTSSFSLPSGVSDPTSPTPPKKLGTVRSPPPNKSVSSGSSPSEKSASEQSVPKEDVEPDSTLPLPSPKKLEGATNAPPKKSVSSSSSEKSSETSDQLLTDPGSPVKQWGVPVPLASKKKQEPSSELPEPWEPDVKRPSDDMEGSVPSPVLSATSSSSSSTSKSAPSPPQRSRTPSSGISEESIPSPTKVSEGSVPSIQEEPPPAETPPPEESEPSEPSAELRSPKDLSAVTASESFTESQPSQRYPSEGKLFHYTHVPGTLLEPGGQPGSQELAYMPEKVSDSATEQVSEVESLIRSTATTEHENEMRNVLPEPVSSFTAAIQPALKQSTLSAQSSSQRAHEGLKVRYSLTREMFDQQHLDAIAKLDQRPSLLDPERIREQVNVAAITEKMREFRKVEDEDNAHRRFQISDPESFEIRRISFIEDEVQKDEEKIQQRRNFNCCGFAAPKSKKKGTAGAPGTTQ